MNKAASKAHKLGHYSFSLESSVLVPGRIIAHGKLWLIVTL